MSMTTFLPVQPSSEAARQRALWLSTIAFTACFAVWTIFAIIGVRIKQELGLNETQFGLLVGTPILTGSVIRLAVGIWTDQYGGCVRHLPALLRTYLPTDVDRRAGRGSSGGLLCGWGRLRVAVVSDREAGH